MDQNSPRYLPNVANEFATSPLVSPVGFQTETSGKLEHTYILT
jgi:hypothetical protein